MSNVTHSSKDLEDITLSYVATESRMLALQTEEERQAFREGEARSQLRKQQKKAKQG